MPVGPRDFQTLIAADLTASLLIEGRPDSLRRTGIGEDRALPAPEDGSRYIVDSGLKTGEQG